MNDLTRLTTATTYSDIYDLIRHIDAQTERGYALLEVATIQATRSLHAKPDFQAALLDARGRLVDVAVQLEAMVTAAQACGEEDFAEHLQSAAESADDLLIYLSRAAHTTLPAVAAEDEEDQETKDEEHAYAPAAATVAA